MAPFRFSDEEIDRRASELYEGGIRARVETSENIGKILVLDVETGEYEIDASGIVANQRALAKHPGAALFGFRIGYPVVESFGGGSIQSTAVKYP